MCLESVLIDSLLYFTYKKAIFTISDSICKISAPKMGCNSARMLARMQRPPLKSESSKASQKGM